MNAHKLLVALLAVLLVGTAGVAAAPGNAPADAGPAEDEGPPGDAGPPVDLPDPVPDFVSDIHGAIGDFIDGSIDHLGSVVSDLTPGYDGAGADESTEG